MTQQANAPAVGGDSTPADINPADPFNAIADEMLPDTPKDEEEEAPLEGDEPDSELDEAATEEEADDLPPIDAPVSWDAEAKEVFKTLPREAQEIVQKREADRERFVQQKSQEAKNARQEVEQAAYQQLADYEKQVSQHLQQYAQQIELPKPDASLLATDPHTYAYQMRQYEDAQAQRHQAQLQAQHFAQQAEQREAYAEQVRLQQDHQIIVENFPEYADPTTHEKHRNELSAIARELGYPPELIGQARAADIIAMRKVAEYKADAEKYRALQKSKMEKVRSAKGLPKVATPGVSQGSDQIRAQRATAAWNTVKTAKSRNARDEAAATWMENSGWL